MKPPTTPCPVALTSRVMGGKWKARMVWALIRTETLRYSQIRAACSPISDRILSKELKELEELGLISRKEYPVVPPKTEYKLTALGRTLEPVMAAMADWGTSHRAKIVEAAENGGLEGSQ
jgi:DNA-binding HxlR family transcriptional regulator